MDDAREDLNAARSRLREWVDHTRHLGASVRSHEPVYRNPGALRDDLRIVLDALDAPGALILTKYGPKAMEPDIDVTGEDDFGV